jgi:hypothetical protein
MTSIARVQASGLDELSKLVVTRIRDVGGALSCTAFHRQSSRPPARNVAQDCPLAGQLLADGSEPPQLQAADQKYRSVALLKVGSGVWMAVPFALAAKFPGQRQPDLGLRRLHSRWLIGRRQVSERMMMSATRRDSPAP